MAQRLNWKKLLCEERFRESGSNRPTDYHNEFDKDYVKMLKMYCNDKLEKLEDYLVGDKII